MAFLSCIHGLTLIRGEEKEFIFLDRASENKTDLLSSITVLSAEIGVNWCCRGRRCDYRGKQRVFRIRTVQNAKTRPDRDSCRLRYAIKKIVGHQRCAREKAVRGSVKLIGSTTSNRVHLGAKVSTVLRFG